MAKSPRPCTPTPDTDDLIKPAHVAIALMEAGLTTRPVSYLETWRAMMSGAVRTVELPNGKRALRRSDLRLMADVLGVMPAKPGPKPRARSAAEHVAA